jgi:hypothetical protein
MGVWFGDPGYSVGPFQQPARLGIIDRLLQGVNVAMKIGDFYQGMQTHSQAKETGQLKNATATIDLQRSLNPDQPVSLEGGLGEKIEKATGTTLPRVTPEIQSGMAARLMPTPATAAPGAVTAPTDPEQIARQTAQNKGIADLPAVGGYAPIQPQRPKTLEEMIIRQATSSGGGMVGKSTQDLINLNTSLKHPVNPETVRHNQAVEGLTKEQRDIAREGLKLRETPEQKLTRSLTVAREKENLATNSPRNQNIDEETGISMGPGKYRKSTSDNTVPIITEAQAKDMADKGQKITKGTKIIKESDPDYKAARAEAVQFESRDLASGGRTPEQKMARIEDLTAQALQSRTTGQAQRRGGAQPAGQNTMASIKEGETKTIGGVQYKRVNGQLYQKPAGAQ